MPLLLQNETLKIFSTYLKSKHLSHIKHIFHSVIYLCTSFTFCSESKSLCFYGFCFYVLPCKTENALVFKQNSSQTIFEPKKKLIFSFCCEFSSEAHKKKQSKVHQPPHGGTATNK